MEALIDAVAAKTGLDKGMIAKAAPAVIEFLTDKLPEPVGDMIAKAAEGGDVDTGDLMGKGKDMLGGLFGG
ncbi:MAG: hypothetical protein HKN46_04580 [Acidimicrobiia bacterium]|nr:hypothetical protein [Acidimicrobiia bacterium]